MIDIHAHVLPGVDDGSDSMDTSVELLCREIREGVTTVVATPHYCPNRGYTGTVSELEAAYQRLTEEAARRGLPVKILLGQEIYSSDYDTVADKLDAGSLLTMCGTKLVLLEFSQSDRPEHLFDLVYTLSVRGYRVIIAHVERYRWMTVEIAEQLKAESCFLQMNAASYFALSTAHLCKKLLKRDLIDVVAGDIHKGRKLYLKKLQAKLKSPELFDGSRISFPA